MKKGNKIINILSLVAILMIVLTTTVSADLDYNALQEFNNQYAEELKNQNAALDNYKDALDNLDFNKYFDSSLNSDSSQSTTNKNNTTNKKDEVTNSKQETTNKKEETTGSKQEVTDKKEEPTKTENNVINNVSNNVVDTENKVENVNVEKDIITTGTSTNNQSKNLLTISDMIYAVCGVLAVILIYIVYKIIRYSKEDNNNNL